MKASANAVAPALLCYCLLSRCATGAFDGYGGAMLGSLQFPGVWNISSALLSAVSGTLYLGARDTLLSVDAASLSSKQEAIVWKVPEEKRQLCMNKGKTEADCHNYILVLEFVEKDRIYACGTYAFDPQCAFINTVDFSLQREAGGGVRMEAGKGKCPFDPRQRHTTVMADGVLYSATTNNFMGTMPLISRATGPERERVRTEESSSWLSEPEFVSAALVRENAAGDDEKIYFFFSEVAEEYDLYMKVKTARVARVCKGDVGGMKVLQKRWTSFLKAGLV
ncbi:hypothetical protein MATL_G00220510 [Megalops atlanticus]|uniref:Sema domain-containing protein n=1 Tax=Megalops atlanticus TaxID=7932 RepID=A0A9D3PI70_MEGAT|nr:hypothetical protein MATL_G00220510 [Megalops atlanticus]